MMFKISSAAVFNKIEIFKEQQFQKKKTENTVAKNERISEKLVF